MIGTACCCAMATHVGCSSRQPAHHVPHTFRIQALPSSSFEATWYVGSCRLGSVNSGAGLPMRGEGTSDGSRYRPTNRNAAMAVKMANGATNFHMIENPGSGGLRGARPADALRGRHTPPQEAAIRDGQ